MGKLMEGLGRQWIMQVSLLKDELIVYLTRNMSMFSFIILCVIVIE